MRLPKRTFSIRAAMLFLVVGGVAVMLATAFVAGWLSYREQRDRIGASLIAASRALVFAVDNELDEPLAFVNGLSSSSSFGKGELDIFQARTRESLAQYGYVVFIRTPDGRQAVDKAQAVVPGGELRLGKTKRSYLGRIENRWMALVDVPIEDQTGQPVYTLVVAIPNGIFQNVLIAQHFPPSWTSVILDPNWMIVARDIDPEKFVGEKAGGEKFRNARTDQTHEVRLVTGEAAMSAHTHSARYGWTTAIAITEADLFRQALGPVLLAAIGSFIAAGAVIAMAALFSTYLGRAIAVLAEMVRAFPEGTLRSKPAFRLDEISAVAQSVQGAALAVLEGRKLVEKELHDTKRLNELSTVLVGEGSSFKACLDKIVDTALVIAEADKGNIQLFDPVSGSLTIAAQKGFPQDFLNFFGTVRDSASSSGIAMHEKRQIIVDDVLTSDRLGQPAQKASLDAGVRGVVSTPLISSKGDVLGMLSIHYARPGRPGEHQLRLLNILTRQATDYLERKQSEQTNKTILGELQHRSNNLLAVIQSLAHRSLEAGSAKEAFEARLQALARANRALLKSNWTGAYIDQLVRTELEAFSKRAAILGPSLLLPPSTAQNFTLALHELATNSAKHGSLSSSTGKLRVVWTIKSTPSGSVLNFKWQESDGPPVAAPLRQGFGTQLLQSVFRDVRLDYAVDGLRCEIEVPLGRNTSETQAMPEVVNA